MPGVQKTIPISKSENIRRSFQPPAIPKEEWCDFRVDYENGMTLKDIADKYFCDPRTVRKSILQNHSSHSIGKQYAPTRLSAYTERIEELYHILTQQNLDAHPNGICKISIQITELLRSEGYNGSERTVRNFLRQKFPITIQKSRNSMNETERTTNDQN